VDVPTSSSSCPSISCDCHCTNYDITAIVCGITIPLAFIIIALVTYILVMLRKKTEEEIAAKDGQTIESPLGK